MCRGGETFVFPLEPKSDQNIGQTKQATSRLKEGAFHQGINEAIAVLLYSWSPEADPIDFCDPTFFARCHLHTTHCEMKWG